MAGLEDLYREIILDHYRSPRHRGQLDTPPAVKAEGFNPLCGDEVVVYLAVDDGVVTDVAIDGQGCSISQSSASMMSAAIKGRSVDEVRALVGSFKQMMSSHETELSGDDDDAPTETADSPDLGDLAAPQGVVKFPVRIKCATLSWNTLVHALDEATA